MLACPNKLSREWQNLSEKLGEDRAMLAFIRKGNEMPVSVAEARELITNVGLLKSFESLPTLSEEKIKGMLMERGLIYDSSQQRDGLTYYALNMTIDDLGKRLGDISTQYGAVLQYSGDYVAINPAGVDSWNNIASQMNKDKRTGEQVARSFLRRIGVPIEVSNDIMKRYGSNGVADMAEWMVRIQEGKEMQALPEEALHFFIDMLPQDMPELREALDKIRNTQVYKDTLAEYKDNPNYRTPDGKIRFDKIQREALAKKLASNIKAKESWLGALLQRIMTWVKALKLKRDPIDILEEMFMAEDISNLNMNLTSSEVYNQLTDEAKSFYEAQSMNDSQKDTLNKIIAISALIKREDNNSLTVLDPITGEPVRLKSPSRLLGSDFYSELESPDVVLQLVSNYDIEFSDVYDIGDSDEVIAKKIAAHLIDKIIKGEYEKEDIQTVLGDRITELLYSASENQKKTLFGTAIHSIVENIIMDREIDLDNLDPIIYTFMDKSTLDKVINGTLREPGIRGIIRKLIDEGHILMTETEIGNLEVGGVADVIAIDKNGVAHILDFKTKFLKDRPEFKKFTNLEDEFNYVIDLLSTGGVRKSEGVLPELVGNRRRLREKYSQQMSIYKKILMSQGVKVGDTTIIGVGYKIDPATNKINKIGVFQTAPTPFNDRLANGYFPDLDMSMDANRKEETSKEEDARVKLLENISKPRMKEAFAKMKGRLDQIYAYFKKNKDVRNVYDLLTDEDKVNKVEQMERLVKTFLENYGEDGDLRNMVAIQKAFIELVDSAGPIINIISKEFDRLKALTPATQQAAIQKIKELEKIKDFVIGYENVFKEMLDALGTTVAEDNILVDRLTQMMGAIENIRTSYIKAITPHVASTLSEEFTKDLLDNMKREYNELIKAAEQRKDKKRVAELTKERDQLASYDVIKATMTGGMGDAGAFLSKWLPTISNPDVVIASVAKRLKRVLDGVRLKMKDFRDKLSPEFNKRAKVYGRGLNIKEINQSLVYEAKRLDIASGDESFGLVFKSEFDESLYYEYDKLKRKLYLTNKKFEADEVSEDEVKRVKKEIKDFERKYFESDYTKAYFDLTKMLDTEVMYGNKKTSIREITSKIFEEIRGIEMMYDNEAIAEGKLSEDHLKTRQELWEKYYSLMEIKNLDGTDKTGDDLKIAQALREYQKNKNLIYEDVELRAAFERAKTKMKLTYGEDSEMYKRWLANNTRQVISQRYYDERAALFTELSEISKNPNADRITELYKELNALTKPYRDNDGAVVGSKVPSDKIQRIKDLQQEIESLRDEVEEYTPDGFTYAEKQTLKQQFYFRTNEPENYDKYTVNSIYAARDERLSSDPDLRAKVERAGEIKAQLKAMGNMEYTKYYYEELDRQEIAFAKELDVSHEELRRDDTLYDQFRESAWFLENHNKEVRSLFDTEHGESLTSASFTPIAIWTRNAPLEEYIEEKPARHFYSRKLKESYINEKGEEVKLINKDNRDIQNRYKPKSNEEYRKEYGTDHPYLNKDFVSLRDKYNNNTANEYEKVDYENLLFIHKEMLDAQQDIEPRYRLGLAVPFMEKSKTERALGVKVSETKESVKSVWQGIKRSLSRTESDVDTGFASDPGVSRDMAKLATIDNDEVKYVPVKYTSKGQASDASYDVWGSVLNYVGSTIRKKELDKELSLINGLEQILSDQENQPKSESKNLMLNNVMKKYLPEVEQRINLGSNIRLEVFKSFINSVLYNEEHFEGYDVLGFNTQKMLNQMMGLTSFTLLGLSPLNWSVNWISGNVQNMVEAAGGRVINYKDFMQAKKDLYLDSKNGHIMKDMMADFNKVGELSFWGQMMEIFDPIQGNFENEFGNQTAWNSFKNILKLGIYSGKVWGEWEIQMSSFLAYLKSVRLYNGKMYDRETFVTMKVGTDFSGMTLKQIREKKLEALREFDKLDVNLIDIFEMKDKKVQVKDQYKNAFDLNSKQFSDVVSKLHAMQKRINGSYAKFDAAYQAKSSIGRAMFFFRKYFMQLGMNRWGIRRADYEGMSVEQGFYLTFLQTAGKDLIKMRLNVVKNWENYSDMERAAIKRTFADLGAMLLTYIIYGVMFGYDDDEKGRLKELRRKSWFTQYMVYTMLKVRSETEQFIPLPQAGLGEIQRIYSNPSILLNINTNFLSMAGLMIDHLLGLFGGDTESLYYKRDSGESEFKERGDSKLLAMLVQTFIGYTGKTFHPVDAIQSFEYQQRAK